MGQNRQLCSSAKRILLRYFSCRKWVRYLNVWFLTNALRLGLNWKASYHRDSATG